MNIAKFISKITSKGYSIEFAEAPNPMDTKFTVINVTEDGQIYRIQMHVGADMFKNEVDVWGHLMEEITHLMNKEMRKEYPKDSFLGARALLQYVAKFVKDNQIHGGEAIYQDDSLNLQAPELMDKCCELIGYYEDEDE